MGGVRPGFTTYLDRGRDQPRRRVFPHSATPGTAKAPTEAASRPSGQPVPARRPPAAPASWAWAPWCGSEGGPDRVAGTLELYQKSLNGAHGPTINSQNALMTAGFCHEDAKVAKSRGTELISWYLDQAKGTGTAGLARSGSCIGAARLPGLLRTGHAPGRRSP